MSLPAAGPDPRAAAERLMQRLEGTRPDHSPEHFRLGAGLAQGFEEPLKGLFPREVRPAAVLIGLVERTQGPAILLTVRASHLRHHAGQIAFPGGRMETSDADPAATALREAEEEIGLAPEHVQVIGYLPDHLILTGFRVTPVVARVASGFSLRFDPGEVQATFELPWAQLLDPAHHVQYRRRFADIEVEARDIVCGEHRIWGATAGMLFCLRELALT